MWSKRPVVGRTWFLWLVGVVVVVMEVETGTHHLLLLIEKHGAVIHHHVGVEPAIRLI